MKKIYILYSIIVSVLFTFNACDDYLSTITDNRAELDTEEKITSLLVSAYPEILPLMITELATDNVMDNGSNFTYYTGHMEQQEAYLWKDFESSSNDTPDNLWDAVYNAIASANHALVAIEEMGSPESLNPQKGEALLCRAFGHFLLVNVFCNHYNPSTASSDMGIPYSLEPESTAVVEYGRGTVAQVYELINKDIEEALPLISDEIYSVPKYHFNTAAAYALAARFNLYYLQYDKVIQYATKALGDNPSGKLRNYQGKINTAATPEEIGNLYIAADEPANFLILPATSMWPYVLTRNAARRYGHARTICLGETFWTVGPWGTGGSDGYLIYGSCLYSASDQLVFFPKLMDYFEFTDKTNNIGNLHMVNIGFSADETLLCRAEAYIHKEDYTNALKDLNYWNTSHCKPGTPLLTLEGIQDFFENRVEETVVDEDFTPPGTLKKKLNPLGFEVKEGLQESLIHCLLHMRRLETLGEGLRWYDIKRYGIEIAHNRDGLKSDVLKVNDPRRAIQLPGDVIDAGLKANPR